MRTEIELNNGWRFAKIYDLGISENDAVTPEFDDCSWEKICLPHTFNATDSVTSSYYKGLTCYRRDLELSTKYKGKALYIEFGGANTTAKVFVNGFFAGKHDGGYSAFRINITNYVHYDRKNQIAVLVDNSPTNYIAPITEQGDFTKMGGLYREVKLIAAEPVHIALEDSGSCGVYITPHNITSDSADIDVLIKLDSANSIEAKAVIFAPDGKPVAEMCGHTESDRLTLSKKISAPQLWDGVNSPCLYRAEVTLFYGDKATDMVSENFGIRTYHINPEDGFFLNGKSYPLHGVNYHQDSFESGWAMTNIQRERDYGIIRDMGCNAVRMAHYQHCSQEYSLCDDFGICVWTEIGIINKMSPDESERHILADGFTENAKQQLIELIRQNYNHPSIILWGISNELHQMSDEIFALYQELYELACKEDNTRLKTYADNQFYGRFLQLPTDVVGYNRYFGWYEKKIQDIKPWVENLEKEYPHQKLMLTEYGADANLNHQTEYLGDALNWTKEFYPETFQTKTHEYQWAAITKHPYIIASYVWNMFDFACPMWERGGVPARNMKGLVTFDRKTLKDSYFWYKANWSKNPVLYLTQRRNNQRETRTTSVTVYSNLGTPKVFLNGKALDNIRKGYTEVHYIIDNVTLANGENKLQAVITDRDGKEYADEIIWHYQGEQRRSTDNRENRNEHSGF